LNGVTAWACTAGQFLGFRKQTLPSGKRQAEAKNVLIKNKKEKSLPKTRKQKHTAPPPPPHRTGQKKKTKKQKKTGRKNKKSATKTNQKKKKKKNSTTPPTPTAHDHQKEGHFPSPALSPKKYNPQQATRPGTLTRWF